MPDSFNRVTKIDYATELNPKQQEQHLFQKCSAILADYGYVTIKLSDDWKGADFIALSQISGEFFKIQLKSRFTIATKYEGQNVYIAFPVDRVSGQWCIFPHDELVELLHKAEMYVDSPSWIKGKEYSTLSVSKNLSPLLEKYMLR